MSKTPLTIGILGGMGPEATALFFYKIIKLTPAKFDQEHLKIIIYNNPQVPDRTEAILNRTTDKLIAEIKEGILFLDRAKVNIIVIPCVTVHYFFEKIKCFTNIPILNIIEETTLYIQNNYPKINKVGLLATTGTIKSKIFHKMLYSKNFQLIVPDEKNQVKLMESIYGNKGIKSGNADKYTKQRIIRLAYDLIEKGAEVIIGGCTEIPLLISHKDLPVPFVDPLTVLAQAVIVKAGLIPKVIDNVNLTETY